MHWDGKKWIYIPITGLGNLGQLNGVSAVSKNDVWAVGTYYTSNYTSAPILLHWDEHKWSPFLDMPFPEQTTNILMAVEALSKDDVWAVGRRGSDNWAIHWDGHTWSETPTPKRNSSQLVSLAAVGPDDVWAAGTADNNRSFILHWNGNAWANVPVPGLEGLSSKLEGLAARSNSDLWAVGTTFGVTDKPLLIHWDGTAWSVISDAFQAERPNLTAVAIAPDSSVWIAGSYLNGDTERIEPLLVRGTTAPCPPSPTPTPGPRQPLEPPVPFPSNNSKFFPETGMTISGIFLDYWQTHGGLAQQGYPISAVMGEKSDLDGKLYTVQYFERAVFEYHPENRPPYNILLSQLGTFEYRKKYPSGAPGQKANNEPGSLFFQATGHRLGGAFQDYWLKNGGLPQQGYPISNEFTEVSKLDGKPYTVQYFERAVFEWHPENMPPYDVLLSHLGRFRYDTIYKINPTPEPRPTPRLLTTGLVGKAAANERYLFWRDNSNPANHDIIAGYDLVEKRKFVVSDRPAINNFVTANSKIVAWVETADGGHTRVRSYDPLTGNGSVILESGSEGGIAGLALDDETLYYQDLTAGHKGLFAHDLATDEERLVSAKGTDPVAADGNVLWLEYEQTCAPGSSFCPWDWALHLQTRDGSILDRVLTRSGENGFSSYDVSGDRVVWSNYGAPPVLYDIKSNTTRTLTIVEGYFPIIKGDLVVWAGNYTTSTIKVYNIPTADLSKLYPGSDPATTPQDILGGNVLAYGSGDNTFKRERIKSLYIISLDQPR
jgi:hypothetical protein